MYIALWTEEVWVDNPYYTAHSTCIEPAKIKETRQRSATFATKGSFYEFVIKNQSNKTILYFEAEQVYPVVKTTVEVSV